MARSSESRSPGRPRSTRAREAILAASLSLVAEEGPRALTMEGIARRSGTSKETVYRWWGSKAEILFEALAERSDQNIAVPDTGSFAGDLHTFLHATAAAGDDATRDVLLVLAAEAATDDRFRVLLRDRFIARRRDALGEVLERAEARGETDPSDRRVILDLVFGSLWYRSIFALGDIDARWADDVTRVIVRIARPSGDQRSRADGSRR